MSKGNNLCLNDNIIERQVKMEISWKRKEKENMHLFLLINACSTPRKIKKIDEKQNNNTGKSLQIISILLITDNEQRTNEINLGHFVPLVIPCPG